MYRRKNKSFYLLGFPALAVIFFSLLTGLSEPEPDKVVQSLIRERTRILMSTSSGHLRPAAAEHRLRQIEQDAVLEGDLASLTKAAKNTQLGKGGEKGQFCFIKFKELKRKKTMFEYITYEARIQWDIGASIWSGIYNIAIQNDAGSFRLTVFEPVYGSSYGKSSEYV